MADQKATEDALRESEARLAGILAIAADSIITVDSHHRITLFNDGAEAMFGYRRAEVIGKPLDILLPERARELHRLHVQRFGQSTTTARRMGERQQVYGLRKSGDEFPAEASISRHDFGGRRTYTVILRDITDRRRSEEMLARSRAELEQRVVERTAELSAEIRRREETEAQLVRTQRMEAFGQLTGGIAHDFNNLLTVIIGNLELLEMRLKDERQLALLSRAREASEMGARLTSRLLTFARRRKYESQVLDLNDQILGMVELLTRSLGDHINLTTRLAPSLWAVRADPSEIENAILNLAINARDAMPKGGELSIETRNVSAEANQIGAITKLAAGDYVRISVSDSGTGMTPDVLRHAFEPFFTTKTPGKGTGLGLSTIYGLVEALGGTATIYSEVDHGTTVSLYLPRDHAEAPAPVSRNVASIPVSAGETVLLVEDNTEVREVTRERLAELGYIVLEAESGPDAVEQLRSQAAIDVVLSDVVMAGGMSGFDVARAVARDRPGLKTLLMSGYAEDVLRDEGGGSGGLRILRKPFGRAELATALREVLDA
ncbi:MAG TPA: PAS domain S-box protein [Hyphomicrobiaceae bacterium]|nr:PAS domain S-box protein [Hyphomicrobiaceae bacterium]